VLSPYEAVTAKYELPFPLWDLQIDAINTLAVGTRSGFYAEVGTGKTVMSTVSALYRKINSPKQKTIIIVIMPPILLTGWSRWLQKIPSITSVIYKGSPAERKLINLHADFVLVSLNIFKNDVVYLTKFFADNYDNVIVVVDEATSIKNSSSENHKKVREFAVGRDLMLLTGTPLSTPMDAYAYIKLISPTIYRNQRHFENLHVGERDFFGQVKKWENLDFLKENMEINSCRILQSDVLKDLPPERYIPLHYSLDKEHTALYKKLANEQILLLEDGGKIDATQATRLRHCMQQIVLNPDHFLGKEMKPAGYELLDQILAELNTESPDGHKLIIFANYKMTNRKLVEYLQPYGVVACYSEVSAAQQMKNIDRFMNDPTCRVAVLNPLSAGQGLDGLQDVCKDILFLELPIIPKDFIQAVGRLHRAGQKYNVNVRIAIAEKTIQESLLQDVLRKDVLVNKVQRGFADLKDLIFGNV
jgi:SNF2 family DNA or RNA helicase